jgi:hypothetical protein
VKKETGIDRETGRWVGSAERLELAGHHTLIRPEAGTCGTRHDWVEAGRTPSLFALSWHVLLQVEHKTQPMVMDACMQEKMRVPRTRSLESIAQSAAGRRNENKAVLHVRPCTYLSCSGVRTCMVVLIYSSHIYLLPSFRNIRCFSFVKLMYLDIF